MASLQQPYGDIFTPSTTYIDRASQQLDQEQRQREQYRQRQNESLDNEFKALLPGIRTGDTDKFAELYNDYKTSWQKLHIHPPTDQKEYLKQQQDLLQKKAAMYNHVTNSKLKAAEEKATGSSVMGDKTGLYRDDAHDILAQGMRLPYDQQIEVTNPQTGQKEKIDWTNPDALKRHVDTKSVMDAIKFSTGSDQKYSGDKYKEKPTNLQYTQPEITVKNKPTTFYDNMKLAATKDPRSFLNTLPQPTQQEYFDVEKHYNEVMTPEMKKKWRMSEGEDLPPDEGLTDLEKAIKYQAMTHALNNIPRVTNKLVTDLEARMNKSDEIAMKHIAYNDQMQGSGSKYNDVAAQLKSDIESNNAKGVTYLSGGNLKRAADVFIKETENKYPLKPKVSQDDVKIRMDDKGNFEVSYSDAYLGKHPNAKPLITTMTPDEVNAVANKSLGVSAAKSSMTGKSPTTKIEIPSATRAEWKANGWTDKQIDEQSKKGKIKVK